MLSFTQFSITMGNAIEKKGSILLIGVSRGLGEAIALEFVKQNWHVTGTVRSTAGAGLVEADVQIEQLDITMAAQIQELHDRLAARGSTFDMLFVNAGVSRPDRFETIADVSDEDFAAVMLTNVLGAMRVVEGLQDLVRATGLIGVMSSGQGSVANNTKGGHEVYRASKAALNQTMRSYAARHADEERALILMAPGWIQTDMGGSGATFTIDETIPQLVATLIDQVDEEGLRYIDRFGKDVPW